MPDKLGGAPNFSPEGLLTPSHAEYVEWDSLTDMIKEDIVAERIADDPMTRRMLEGILAMEEEHAEDPSALLEQLGQSN